MPVRVRRNECRALAPTSSPPAPIPFPGASTLVRSTRSGCSTTRRRAASSSNTALACAVRRSAVPRPGTTRTPSDSSSRRWPTLTQACVSAPGAPLYAAAASTCGHSIASVTRHRFRGPGAHPGRAAASRAGRAGHASAGSGPGDDLVRHPPARPRRGRDSRFLGNDSAPPGFVLGAQRPTARAQLGRPRQQRTPPRAGPVHRPSSSPGSR